MRAVIQRVTRAQVDVLHPDGSRETTGSIQAPGALILVASTVEDTVETAALLAEKIYQQRILENETSLATSGGSALVVSQFTLYADARRGRRPSYSAAAPAVVAEPMYNEFCRKLRERVESTGGTVEEGVFGAMMEITSTNHGPYTLLLDTDDLMRPRR